MLISEKACCKIISDYLTDGSEETDKIIKIASLCIFGKYAITFDVRTPHSDPYFTAIFETYLLDGTEASSLGSLKLNWIRPLKNDRFGHENTAFSSTGPILFFDALKYPADQQTKNRIFIEWAENSNAKYSEVGTALVKATILWGDHRGCEGRVTVAASWSSHCFWYKLGFRSADPRFGEYHNKGIEAAIAQEKASGQKADTSTMGGIRMYLPPPAQNLINPSFFLALC